MTYHSLNPTTFITLVCAFTAGIALGALYFTALWKTVQMLPGSKNPARLMLTSYFLRVIVVMAGFYLVMGGHWERLMLAMFGFIIIKKILTYRLGPQNEVETVH